MESEENAPATARAGSLRDRGRHALRWLLAGTRGTLAHAAGPALRHVRWILVEHHFQVIDDGKVYQSGRIPPEDLPAALARYGIRTVVDLRKHSEGVGEERAALSAHVARYVHLPARQVPDTETVEAFLQLTADPSNFPILVHCNHGRGRASVFAALYRIEHLGWENDRARRATRRFPEWSGFARSRSKGRYLLGYRRSQRSGALPEPAKRAC